MNIILITIAVLAGLGLISAIILYFVSQKFKIIEDERISEVENVLPGANCGGCGFAGCHALAEALVKATDTCTIGCPVGGASTMNKIAQILGKEVTTSVPKIAVVRCNGTCQNRQKTLIYDGAKSCAIAATNFAGETNCSFGCLGYGDCVSVCKFDAIKIDEQTNLPTIDESKCVACGACAKACPKSVIEIRNKGPKDRRLWVACINKDKGAIARKACNAACIGCGKCAKECQFEAITIENNVAYIDYNKCKLCRKCIAVCPTQAIHEINFPARTISKSDTNKSESDITSKEKVDKNE